MPNLGKKNFQVKKIFQLEFFFFSEKKSWKITKKKNPPGTPNYKRLCKL
jgi:hypothetical protein